MDPLDACKLLLAFDSRLTFSAKKSLYLICTKPQLSGIPPEDLSLLKRYNIINLEDNIERDTLGVLLEVIFTPECVQSLRLQDVSESGAVDQIPDSF